MEVNRKGNEITIILTSEEEAIGLYSYLSGTIHTIPSETASKGAWLYSWFFSAIAKLANNFEQEKSSSTMSAETVQGLPVSSTTASKRKPKR